jgi:hypothetical protein
MGNSKNKYNNKKVTYDGIIFDSTKEARRYQMLKLLLRAGAISDLRLQVPYELIPAQYINGKCVERAVKYIADFVYTENGKEVVEDAKGVRTDTYKIKRKLMLYVHGIKIKEV